MKRFALTLVTGLALAGSASAQTFFAANNDRLVRTDLNTYDTFTLSADIHSLDWDTHGNLWATSRAPNQDGFWNLYRVEDPFGTPSLQLVNSMLPGAVPAISWIGDTLYGLQTISETRQNLVTIDVGSGNTSIIGATGNTGITGGGMDYDSSTGTMYAIRHFVGGLQTLDFTLSGGPDPSAAPVGNFFGAESTLDLRSSDLAVLDGVGSLYGLLVERDTLHPILYSIDKGSGLATEIVDLSAANLLGFGPGGTALAVIPEPSSIALLIGGLASALIRRR